MVIALWSSIVVAVIVGSLFLKQAARYTREEAMRVRMMQRYRINREGEVQ